MQGERSMSRKKEKHGGKTTYDLSETSCHPSSSREPERRPANDEEKRSTLEIDLRHPRLLPSLDFSGPRDFGRESDRKGENRERTAMTSHSSLISCKKGATSFVNALQRLP